LWNFVPHFAPSIETKNVELCCKASVLLPFLRQSYKNPFCATRTGRTKRKISLLAQSFDIANTISVGNLMLSMSMLDFPQERLSSALFLERR